MYWGFGAPNKILEITIWKSLILLVYKQKLNIEGNWLVPFCWKDYFLPKNHEAIYTAQLDLKLKSSCPSAKRVELGSPSSLMST